MKPFKKRKASKVTFKEHHKHKPFPKDDLKKAYGGMVGYKPEDLTR